MNMSEAKNSRVISGDNVTFERWQAPDVQSVAQQQQEQAGLLTARQLEELQKQAYDEGFQLGQKEGYQAAFEQGLQEGQQQGILKGQEEVEQTIKRFAQIMKFLAEPLTQVNDDVEQELISLSIAMAKQIIRREINMDPGQIVAVIKEALSALPSSSKNIKVFLHPADAQVARDSLAINTQPHEDSSSNYDSEHTVQSWSIIDEPTITRGGCRIKSEFSQIDASIDTRIAEISARILGSERVHRDTVQESEAAPVDLSVDEAQTDEPPDTERASDVNKEHREINPDNEIV